MRVISTDKPSSTECKTFREDVWGKQLLARAGAKKIIWSPLKEANTLSISLWKEWTDPPAFSIVFRAVKKYAGRNEWELIELRCRISPGKRHLAEKKPLTPSFKWPNQRRTKG